jgi:hypothetical protein
MSGKLENNEPNVMAFGLNTSKNASLGGTLSVTGAATLASTLAVTGVATFTAAPVFSAAPTFSGGQTRTNVQLSALVGATVALTAADSGALLINRSTSGSPSWTLPTNVAGLYYTFYVRDVTTGFTVTGGTIKAKTNAAGAAISGTTLTNTQATAVIGDTITLLADGTNWDAIAQSGIFGAA